MEAEKRLADTNAAALTLEMVGDLPHAEVRPPENILFVCKLNPVTRSEDLELIFSRFGTILSCEVIKDKKVSAGEPASSDCMRVEACSHALLLNLLVLQTGDSLQYAFIEFDKKEQAEQVSTSDSAFITSADAPLSHAGLLQDAKRARGRSAHLGRLLAVRGQASRQLAIGAQGRSVWLEHQLRSGSAWAG